MRRLAGSAYEPLPACSYHVTLLDGITAEGALGDQAPSGYEMNGTWRHYLRLRSSRLRRANALLGFDDPLGRSDAAHPSTRSLSKWTSASYSVGCTTAVKFTLNNRGLQGSWALAARGQAGHH